jgi:ElaB/YqjD/DUF883 family membrane-anchored ribosome-binding protein
VASTTKGIPRSVLHSTRETTQPALERTRQELQSLDRSARAYVRGHPVVALLVAVSAGYTLGRILRGRGAARR